MQNYSRIGITINNDLKTMLQCNVNLAGLTDKHLECVPCEKCTARSKLEYPFKRDLTTSEALVKALKDFIEASTSYECAAPEIVKNPDICVLDITQGKRLICRVEAKLLEGFAFMKAEKLLGDHLKPKETLVVDEPKLLSYFECKDRDFQKLGRVVPIFVVWKYDKPCADLGGITVFQEISELKNIYVARGKNRKFERKTVESDMEHGHKLGITSKYHFSLKECRPIEDLIAEILAIK